MINDRLQPCSGIVLFVLFCSVFIRYPWSYLVLCKFGHLVQIPSEVLWQVLQRAFRSSSPRLTLTVTPFRDRTHLVTKLRLNVSCIRAYYDMVVVTRASQSSRQGSARSKPPLQSSSTSNHDLWVAKKLRGSYPPLTITSRTVIDPRREKVYIYGGFHDADKAQMPTPNFHVFDTKSMEFTDLTVCPFPKFCSSTLLNLGKNSLTRVTAGDLILDMASKRRHHRLPSLSQPGLALLELRDSHIIFLFGGYDAGDIDGPSSSLIAINPVLKTWFRVEFETNDFSPPAPRINPVLVGVNESLYIFGGLKGFENPWLHHRSYSIAKFPSGLSSAKCRWIAVDVPYPDTIPTEDRKSVV